MKEQHKPEWYFRTVGLCAGRHEIPVEEYLFPDPIEDPLDFDAMYKRAMSVVPESGHLTVYVTGLTAAMLAVVAACESKYCTLYAMHYDKTTGTYKRQVVLNGENW